MSKAGEASPDCVPVLAHRFGGLVENSEQTILFGAIRRIPCRSPFDRPRDRVPAMDVERPNSRAEVHTP